MSSLFLYSGTGKYLQKNAKILRNKQSVFVLNRATFSCRKKFNQGRFWSHAR